MSLAFKFAVEFEKLEDGTPSFELRGPNGEPHFVAVAKTPRTPTVEAAKTYCMELESLFHYPDGTFKQITRIHFKDIATGECYNLVKCEPVADHAINNLPRLRSFADAPKTVVP